MSAAATSTPTSPVLPAAQSISGPVVRFHDAIAAVSQRFALIAVVAVLLIAFSNVVDVILRNFFHSTLIGLSEVNVLLVSIAVSSCLPYGMARGAPLRIMLLKDKVSPLASAWLDYLANLVTLMFFGLLAWRFGATAATMNHTGETTMMIFIPKSPFIWAVTAALVLTTLMQAAVSALRAQEALVMPQNGRWITFGLITIFVVLVLMTLSSLLPTSYLLTLKPSSPMLLALIAFLGMWVLILISVPIGVAMGIVGVVGTAAILKTSSALGILGSETTSFIQRDALSVLPLFLLMGTFASLGGIGTDLFRLGNALVGHVRGGLAHASIMACAGFGMLTGSSIATQLSIGKIALVEMRKHNYSDEISSGSVAAGGTLGQLIPPSSALILYAALTEQSVGRLFMGAVIPGILATLLYMGVVAVWLWIYPRHAEKGSRSSLVDIYEASKEAWAVFLLLGLVLGGIYCGFFTELEAGSVGAVGGFLIALARGRLNRRTFWETMAGTTNTLALMYSLIFGVVMLTFFFGISGLPDAFVAWVQGLGLSNLGIILCLVACYLILGTVMDAFAMMVITIPIFVPLVNSMGYDPIWWGLMTLVCMEAGQISPPFGINIFVIKSMDMEMPMSAVYRGVTPFFMSTIVKIALLILFPVLVTYLPSTMAR